MIMIFITYNARISCCTLCKFFLLRCLKNNTITRATIIIDTTAIRMNISTPTTAPTTVESSSVLSIAVTDIAVDVVCGRKTCDVV